MTAMQFLARAVAECGLALTDQQLNQFATYQTMLLQWNKRMNLTAAKTPQEIQERHFADSLTCSLVTGDLTDKALIDVGSGAGFPGLPLKILYPDLTLTLLDSTGKKASFLTAVVAELGLQNVSVIAARAETLGQDSAHRQQYDWAAARAVAHLSPVLEYLLPFCRVGGHALAQKGARVYDELLEAGEAIAVLGGKMGEIFPVPITGEDKSYLVVIDKVRETPARYPRRPGVPLKRPL